MYNLGSTEFISQHGEVACLINNTVPAERIYLLGLAISGVRTSSIFVCDAPTRRHVSHYYLLVVVNECGTSSVVLQDKIENACNALSIPVTAIVLMVEQFNTWLSEGHQFACKVAARAECLHDAGNVPHIIPAAINQQQLHEGKQQQAMAGINRVGEFLTGADLYIIRKQNKMAAFMLHQAAEQALHTLLRITTGMYTNTHSIDRLIRYCSMTCYKLPQVFNCSNEKEKHLFQLLQKAYIDTRYKEDYNITTTHLQTLRAKVATLETILKETTATTKN
jgi:HEPN domain-containing protein/galactitol-specific phosphotransferase system IIB component